MPRNLQDHIVSTGPKKEYSITIYCSTVFNVLNQLIFTYLSIGDKYRRNSIEFSTGECKNIQTKYMLCYMILCDNEEVPTLSIYLSTLSSVAGEACAPLAVIHSFAIPLQ